MVIIKKYGEGTQSKRLIIAQKVYFILALGLAISLAIAIPFMFPIKNNNFLPSLEAVPITGAVLLAAGLFFSFFGPYKDSFLYNKIAMCIRHFTSLALSIMLIVVLNPIGAKFSASYAPLIGGLVIVIIFAFSSLFFVFIDIFLPLPAPFIKGVKIFSYGQAGASLISILLSLTCFLNLLGSDGSVPSYVLRAWQIGMLVFIALSFNEVFAILFDFLYPDALEDIRSQITFRFN
ncbi:MAG: hypothetical protein LKJ88_04055 [Bacilli bacterium]|jgi:hypothetical protein|nr:hypothetical protein [Bacilli bacterium]